MNEKSEKQRVKHRKHSPEFKDRALVRAETEGVSQAAKNLSRIVSYRKRDNIELSHKIKRIYDDHKHRCVL